MSHETLRVAYEAHQAATKKYFDRIHRIIGGDPSGNDGMPEIIAELKATHEAFMREGETIMRRGPRR